MSVFDYDESMAKRSQNSIMKTLILLLAAFIWGVAFVGQKVGSDYLEPFSFLFFRSILAWIGLQPVVWLSDALFEKHYRTTRKPKNKEEWKVLLKGGILAGSAVFFLSLFQQMGIPYVPTAKAGFITSMYIVIVPLFSVFKGKKISFVMMISVVLSIVGLYLLSNIRDASLSFAELYFLLAALFGAIQILVIEKYSPLVDAVRLSVLQFVVMAVYSGIGMLLFEHPTLEGIRGAFPALLFTGIVSGGIAYTLQIVGQNGLDPTIASLSMCMESVFSALGGYVFLQQVLSPKEWLGCGLMFVAIVLANLPIGRKQKQLPS